MQHVALRTLTAGIVFWMATAPPLSAQQTAAVGETTSTGQPTGLPIPGPDLLNYTPEEIEAAYSGRPLPEAVAMYLIIVRGGQLDGSGGWFKPAVSRYTWSWLAERHGADPEQPLPRDAFQGDADLFRLLDRDRDGALSRGDLDWSDSNPWVRQSYMINRLFRRIDPAGDGELTRDEWQAFFSTVAGDQETFRFEQLRDALIPPGNGFAPGDAPNKDTLVRGLMAGEIGSLQEGPELNQPAPDFELRPLDGGAPVRLSDRIGKRPVVLVFGNFTCGPFRSMYSTVEAVRARQQEHADFLLVYVREAHPTDGWAMKSNEKAGVAVAQPTTLTERQAVATQCAAKLKPTMPLLVDDVNDAVGNAWSGMPARLYIVDTQGRIAYKSGRGPFGFKPEEMEQALTLLRLEQQLAATGSAAAAAAPR